MTLFRSCFKHALMGFLLAWAALVQAAPPGTLVYQGRLSDANGNPQNGSFNIELRLYDVATGGAFLWNETQAVTVADGFYSVTLGDTTALPNELFAQRLWLGIEVNGDGEMTPRPALSAAPFALRARTVMRNIVYVAADGTPGQNGAALIAAMGALQGNTAANGYTVFVDAGTFDLGAATLQMKPFVDLVGQGRERTLVTSAANGPTVALANSTGVAAMRVLATGPNPDANAAISAIHGAAGTQGIYLRDLLAEAASAGSVQGFRYGIFLLATVDTRIEDTVATGNGGAFCYGIRTNDAGTQKTTGLVLRNLTGIGRGATSGARGVDILADRVDAQDVTGRAEDSGASTADYRGLRFLYGDGLIARNVVAYAGGADLTSSGSILAMTLYYVNDAQISGLTALAEGTGMFVEGFFVQAETQAYFDPTLTFDRPRIFDAQVRAMGKGSSTTIGVEVWGAAPLLERATVEARNPDAPGYVTALGTRATEFGTNQVLSLQSPFEIRDSSFTQAHALDDKGCGICSNGPQLVLQNVRVDARDGPLSIQSNSVVSTHGEFVTQRPATSAVSVAANASFRSAHGTFNNGVYVDPLGTAECAASVVKRASYLFAPTGCAF